MDTERTLVLVKPDGVVRGLVGDVVSRIERKGLRLAALELRTLDRETAQTHYAEHREKPFFASLVDFITSGPLVAAVVEGPRAIEAFRQLAGATDPVKATTGSIRGRPRARGAEQHRARLRLARIGQARDRPVLPQPLSWPAEEARERASSQPLRRPRNSGETVRPAWVASEP